MRPGNLFNTTTFRLAVIYLALFAVSVLALLGFIYWTTAGFMVRQSDETIAAEITGLAEQYRRTGLPGLTQVIIERSRNQRHSLYLLTDASSEPIAGNLNSWPEVATGPGGWLDFTYERRLGNDIENHFARARHLLLAGGLHLLVGRDISDRREIDRLLRSSLAWALALTLGLGLVGGVIMSRNMMRRIDAINRTSHEIIEGDLSRRIPLRGSNDELDELARNLNAMLDRIEELMVAMRQVTDNIAHDMRSPLNRMRSRLELTLREHPSEDIYRTALEQTVAEAEQLVLTFNALLGIAQIEARSDRENMADIDLTEAVEDVVDLYAPVAEDKGIAIAVTGGELGSLHANRHLLSQALANLIDNAIKYTPAGGKVEVGARVVGETAEIVVADNGPGIPDADRDRVQERFVRLEASRNSVGSGLGLSLVRAVARFHRGSLILEDNAPGLRARLVLPLRRLNHAVPDRT